jgi:hypothetical protein
MLISGASKTIALTAAVLGHHPPRRRDLSVEAPPVPGFSRPPAMRFHDRPGGRETISRTHAAGLRRVTRRSGKPARAGLLRERPLPIARLVGLRAHIESYEQNPCYRRRPRGPFGFCDGGARGPAHNAIRVDRGVRRTVQVVLRSGTWYPFGQWQSSAFVGEPGSVRLHRRHWRAGSDNWA